MSLKNKPFMYPLVLIVVGVITGLVISSNFSWHAKASSSENKISDEAIAILSKASSAMAEVAGSVKPAVVNISSTKRISAQRLQSPLFNDPFFRQFFGDQFAERGRPREQRQTGLGSGVIVDREGYILTNNHVVQDADEIKVKLSDKREFTGKVIGSDPKTDLAVVKIPSHDLPVVTLGNSEKLRAGETVIAIGNPFGLSQTVTSGIVSATGRANVGIADYEDFIQTDAAINPGNSGGALVNIRGELVGINTAIFSTSGGYQGIGFAIPSSMAKVVMDNLIRKGKVVRGWLGVSIQPVTPELAKQFGIKEDKGVLVSDVVEESPAEKAGIKRGDIITEYDGREVTDPAGLRNSVAATPPGGYVSVGIVRDGKKLMLGITIVELAADAQKFRGESNTLLRGVRVQNLSEEAKKEYGIPKRITGVLVTDIDETSPAAGTLMARDVIVEINRRKVAGPKEYEDALSQIKADEAILLLVFRNGSSMYITLSGR